MRLTGANEVDLRGTRIAAYQGPALMTATTEGGTARADGITGRPTEEVDAVRGRVPISLPIRTCRVTNPALRRATTVTGIMNGVHIPGHFPVACLADARRVESLVERAARLMHPVACPRDPEVADNGIGRNVPQATRVKTVAPIVSADRTAYSVLMLAFSLCSSVIKCVLTTVWIERKYDELMWRFARLILRPQSGRV